MEFRLRVRSHRFQNVSREYGGCSRALERSVLKGVEMFLEGDFGKTRQVFLSCQKVSEFSSSDRYWDWV